jgi:hypothetical protein
MPETFRPRSMFKILSLHDQIPLRQSAVDKITIFVKISLHLCQFSMLHRQALSSTEIFQPVGWTRRNRPGVSPT